MPVTWLNPSNTCKTILATCLAFGKWKMAQWVKNPPNNAGATEDSGLIFEPGKSPKESHGQRSLVGYSPWGHKELDTTGQPSMDSARALKMSRECTDTFQ